MIWNRKQHAPAERPNVSPDRLTNMAAMTGRLGLSTVPAAWPTGISQLAQAIDACERCDTAVACADWLHRAPHSIVLPPAFCRNAEAFKRAQAKKRR